MNKFDKVEYMRQYNKQKVHCQVCDKHISRSFFYKHSKVKYHLLNLELNRIRLKTENYIIQNG